MEDFIKRLCFSHFQRWKSKGKPAFSWAEKTVIPIRNAKYVAAKGEGAVFPLKREKGKGPFITRKDYKEVRIYLKSDGQYEVVHIPHNRRDPSYPQELPSGQLKVIYRKGDIVKLEHPPCKGAPSGNYKIEKIKKQGITVLPVFLNLQALKDKKEVTAWNIPPSGCATTWNKFLYLVGISKK